MRVLSIAIVFGTRPEIIKAAPVYEEARARGHRCTLIHTGQHYSSEMSAEILKDFSIKEDINLGCGGSSDAERLGRMIAGVHGEITKGGYDCVLAVGDTDSMLAAVLSCNKARIPFGHIESGLRSFDRNMPEENNRVLADQISDMLFAPSQASLDYLLNSSECRRDRVYMTGNTVMDALKAVDWRVDNSDALERHGLEDGGYVLLTLHRAENVDRKERLETLLESISKITLPVVFPIHPRTRKRISEFELDGYLRKLKVIPPVGYLDFLRLCKGSSYIMTDSGGIQEECTHYKRPVVLLRENTERPEVIGTYAQMVGFDARKIEAAVIRLAKDREDIVKKLEGLTSPYGDGTAARKIVMILEGLL